jgi:DNA polymerase-3 subunit alpha
MDGFGDRRALLEALDRIISVSSSHFRALNSGQLSFFGTVAGVEEDIILPTLVSLDRRELLEWERELIGLYVSDHPISPYIPILQNKITHISGQLGELGNKEKVIVGGMVTQFRAHSTKDGKPMGFATIEDIQGKIELVLFPRTWDQYGRLIEHDRVLLVEGKLDAESGDPKVLVDKMRAVSLDEVPTEEPTLRPPVKKANTAARKPEPQAPARTPIPAARVDFIPADLDDDEVPPEPEGWDEMPFSLDTKETLEPLAAKKVDPTPEVVLSAPVVAPVAMTLEAPLRIAEKPAPFVPMHYLVPPSLETNLISSDDNRPRMVTVIIRATEDKVRDGRRLRRICNLLRSCPGKDRFAFMMFENGHSFLVEFPNDLTGLTDDLIRRLKELVSEENVRIEILQIQ